MTTMSLAIASSTDDADENAAGDVAITGTSLGASLDSTSEWVALRFTGGPPLNARIISATVDVIPTASAEDEPLITIMGLKADPGTWADAPASFNISSNANKTTATVSWSSTNLGANGTTRYSSPDISTVVQEVINNVSTGVVNILFQGGATSTRDLTIKSYDSAVSDAATLTLEFVPPNTQRMSMMGCG